MASDLPAAILGGVISQAATMDNGPHNHEAESAASPAPVAARKKRPWFQFSLGTAIVMMFVAGALLWLNMTERFVNNVELTDDRGSNSSIFQVTNCGWPAHSVTKWSRIELNGKRVEPPELDGVAWQWQWLACDAIVALAICGTIAFVCEWLSAARIACMTDPPKKRPWFQFSLGTTIVLVFVAAGLLWLNLHTYPGELPDGVMIDPAPGHFFSDHMTFLWAERVSGGGVEMSHGFKGEAVAGIDVA
ncbi:MAG: hypothetical protein NTW87_31845 [Planctomycetota bacterium]|nr:hypothetical protein [Planctomycetota bacterium]